ncbi:hypothetical protein J2S17_004560 [Cytobacillus purgationiresistens]|uniref:Uncharacterized protein n=1 Tax=Cytobacillus purgationiresistens TaxID=863449 RepID=A0ABU0AN14_9BACI|nr:hypothetical protein [Cytobacillus purgationiresistens]
MIKKLIGEDVRDSCGSSGTDESPHRRSKADEETHRPPRGKRAPGEEINDYLRKATKYMRTA